ncbi:MAG: glycosyltransferase [Nitrospirae bacterium]|nr:glycosyltransferase [Nitrospirota bacterium]
MESIRSILPIVDEFIVNVGPSEDGTLELVQSIGDKKIKIIQSQWNPNVITGYYICSQQANIALFNCMGKWAFCLHPDEAIHEDDLPLIMKYVDRYIDDDRVEGLVLRELNFYGDYKTILNAFPQRNRRKCKIVKPHRFVLSRGDAAGFTVHPKYKERGRRIRVLETGARLFHYGSVKSEEAMKFKSQTFSQYFVHDRIQPSAWRELYQRFPRQFMASYDDTHPRVMAERVRRPPVSLDLSSDAWRTTLTSKERLNLFKTVFTRYVTDRFSGRASYKLLREPL